MTDCKKERKMMMIETALLESGNEVEIEYCKSCGEFNVYFCNGQASGVFDPEDEH